MSTIGMMDGAFFVGRKEILDWINGTLDLNLSKIEETANGAVACQLLDIMYPNQVPMHKVNWAAKQSFEFVGNYKVLQTCFSKLNIERRIDVDRLISGRYMDNLEFMQWFKRFFEMSVTGKGNYDAVGQRTKGKGGNQYGGSQKKPEASKPASTRTSTSAAPKPKITTGGSFRDASNNKGLSSQGSFRESSGSKTLASAGSFRETPKSKKDPNQENAAPNTNTNVNALLPELAKLRATNDESRRAYAELRVEMEGVEKERDFYFEKLRDIEIMLQELEDKGEGNELTASIFKVLYATADGFEPAVDEPAAFPEEMTGAPEEASEVVEQQLETPLVVEETAV